MKTVTALPGADPGDRLQPFHNMDAGPSLPLDEGDLGMLVGDRQALDDLFSLTYAELRRLAGAVKRGDASATISPTVLVNEAWIKLASSPPLGTLSRLHFKRIAARAMRQVLVDAARRRNAHKRPDASSAITFDDAIPAVSATGKAVLALDAALTDLARLNPRQAAMVESRFFGGLDVAETAELLQVSEATILRDWRAAKAWLVHELRQSV